MSKKRKYVILTLVVGFALLLVLYTGKHKAIESDPLGDSGFDSSYDSGGSWDSGSSSSWDSSSGSGGGGSVADSDAETLKTSYYNLDREAKKLFKDAFKYYDYWPQLKKKAEGKGTYHALKDSEDIKSVIDTYDISIDEFLKRLKKNGVV